MCIYILGRKKTSLPLTESPKDEKMLQRPGTANYLDALKQKQNGTLPHFEEELWRHCCSYYHSSVPECDLCRPRTNEERMAIKERVIISVPEQRNRKRILETDMKENGRSNTVGSKRKRNTELRAAHRQSLTSSAIDTINQRRREQYASKRMKDRISRVCTETTGVIDENSITQYNVGPMTFVCSGCNALMFEKELHHGTAYSLCCGYGKIKVPDIKPPPATLQKLYTEDNEKSKEFRKNIRCYNSALALSSVGVELGTTFKFDNRGPWTYKISGQIYHSLGTILPNANSTPVFSQLYVYDKENELTNRHNRNTDNMERETLKELQEIMHENNPYVQEYMKAAEIIKQNPSQDIQLVLKASGTPDPRRYNLPTGNDIAIVIPQINTDKLSYRDVILYKSADDHPKGYKTVRINEMHPMYDPTAYPLLFIFGDKGYDYELFKPQISKNQDQDQTTEIAHKVTTRKFYRYRLFEREGIFNTLHHSGRLMQQYVTDMWCKIEKEQLEFYRRNQRDLRMEAKQGLTDAMNSSAPDSPDTIGTKVILPSDFMGSPRQMHELYQDSMAIVRHYGKPELFITFTCNPNWPEIKIALKDDQGTADRQDVVNRVFYLKLKEFQCDMFKRDILGNVKAYCWTLEEQKRSLKHIHLLSILQQHITPEWIDKVVWAVIPDRNEMPKLFEIVTTCMLHGPCGVYNPNAPCMIDGKCKAGYPKPYRSYTSLSEDGFALYARPNDGITVEKRGFLFDNRWVVPYNPKLLLKYNAHINVEVCASVKNIKYIYKYVHKGVDMASVGVQASGSQDEITDHVSSRWITPSTATWNTFEFPTHGREPAIERLAIHEENQQKITFRVGKEKEALDRNQDTTLTAWMQYNQEHSDGRDIKYPDFPQYYR